MHIESYIVFLLKADSVISLLSCRKYNWCKIMRRRIYKQFDCQSQRTQFLHYYLHHFFFSIPSEEYAPQFNSWLDHAIRFLMILQYTNTIKSQKPNNSIDQEKRTLIEHKTREKNRFGGGWCRARPCPFVHFVFFFPFCFIHHSPCSSFCDGNNWRERT